MRCKSKFADNLRGFSYRIAWAPRLLGRGRWGPDRLSAPLAWLIKVYLMRLQFSLALQPKFSESTLSMLIARYKKRNVLLFPYAWYFAGSVSEDRAKFVSASNIVCSGVSLPSGVMNE